MEPEPEKRSQTAFALPARMTSEATSEGGERGSKKPGEARMNQQLEKFADACERVNALVDGGDSATALRALDPLLCGLALTIQRVGDRRPELAVSDEMMNLRNILVMLTEAANDGDGDYMGDVLEYEVAPALRALIIILQGKGQEQGQG